MTVLKAISPPAVADFAGRLRKPPASAVHSFWIKRMAWQNSHYQTLTIFASKMRLLLQIVLCAVLLISPALADSQKVGGPLSSLVSKLNKVTLEDLRYADALAVAHNDKIASACWESWISYLEVEQKAITGPDGKLLPLPALHLITDAQRIFDISNALQPTSPLSMACAPLGNAVKLSVLNLITAAATGALISGIPIP